MDTGINEIHREVSRRLERLDLGAMLPGFHPFGFALYDEKQVCLGSGTFPRDERFFANTAIQYRGEWIAIWKLASPAPDLDVLTAKIAHEMCHAFQSETGDKSFPDEINGCFYPRDLANFSVKHEENLLLAGLAEDFTAEGWEKFVRLRAGRLKARPGPVDYELRTESIEGSATYVELEALKALSRGRYGEALERVLSGLKDPSGVFDVRRRSYDSGAVIRSVMAANRLAPVDWLEESLKTAGELLPAAASPGFDGHFRKYFGAVDELVAGALAKAEKMDAGGGRLLGFDPYNVRASGACLYHPYFIMCGDEGKAPRSHMGAFVTKMKGQTREIEEVYRVK